MVRRFLKAAGILLIAGAVILLYLIRFHGLRIERDGSGSRPIFSFRRAAPEVVTIEADTAPPAPPVAAAEPTPAPSFPSPYWTDFRGPRRDGRYEEMPIVVNWPASGPKRLWRRAAGEGYASFVAANGLAFTIEQRKAQEVVAAYEITTGREAWTHGWDAYFQESMGGDGPRATPTWNDGRIYALGAAGELRCLDATTGRRIWSKNILEDSGARNIEWG